MQEVEDAHSKFIFIGGNQSGNGATRIRRHVMRDIGKQRRSNDRSLASNVSRIRVPVRMGTTAVDAPRPAPLRFLEPVDEDTKHPTSGENLWSSQTFITRLGNSRLDPFARYPIPMDRRSRELVWYMFETSLPNNNTFYRYVWYPLAFSSAAAFHQVLSMFPVYLKTTGLAQIVSGDDAHVLLHHNEAVRRVRESLEDPESAASDEGILATIVGMICQSHLNGEVEQWTIHINALNTLVQLRGGAASLNMSPILSFAMRLVDMSTSFSQAKPPSLVTAPCLLEVNSPIIATGQIVSRAVLAWYVKFPASTDLMETILKLWDMFSRLNLRTIQISNNPWGENCIWRFMHPVLDRLLGYRCSENMREDYVVIHEACRISGLLSLSQVRRLLGIAPVPTANYTARAQTLMFDHRADWTGLEFLKLWTLLATALEVQDPLVYERFVQEAVKLVSTAELNEVQELQKELENVMWAESESRRRLQSFWSHMTRQ